MSINMVLLVEAARGVTRGVMIEAGKWLAIGLGTVALLTAVAHWAGYGWDATDDRPSRKHSNVRLRTDYGTGCQYLESRAGSLTPRLSPSGRQVCR